MRSGSGSASTSDRTATAIRYANCGGACLRLRRFRSGGSVTVTVAVAVAETATATVAVPVNVTDEMINGSISGRGSVRGCSRTRGKRVQRRCLASLFAAKRCLATAREGRSGTAVPAQMEAAGARAACSQTIRPTPGATALLLRRWDAATPAASQKAGAPGNRGRPVHPPTRSSPDWR